MKNLLITSWIFSLIIVYLIYYKFSKCVNRIPITYLILASTIFSSIVIQHIIPKSISVNIIKWYIPIFILSIVSIIGLYVAPSNSFPQLAVYILFIILLSLSIHPLYKLSQINNVIMPCLLTTIGIFITLSLVSYINPNLVSFNLGRVLLLGLIGLIFLRLSFFLFPPSNNLIKISSYIGIFIFCGFILYDTKIMVTRATQCNRQYNYLTNVTSLFLDFYNMFVDMMTLSNINKR